MFYSITWMYRHLWAVLRNSHSFWEKEMITSQRSHRPAMLRTEHLWSASLLKMIPHLSNPFPYIHPLFTPCNTLITPEKISDAKFLRHSLSSTHIWSLFPPTVIMQASRETQSSSWDRLYPLMSLNCMSVLQISLLRDNLMWAHLSASCHQQQVRRSSTSYAPSKCI
jgi:hypothetical protein